MTSLEWQSFQFDGETPGQVHDPMVQYYEGKVYLTCGLPKLNDCDTFLYEYNFSTMAWSVVSDKSSMITCRYLAKSTVFEGYFYVFFGWQLNEVIDSSQIYRISLKDKKSVWELVLDDPKLAKDSYSLVQINDSVYFFAGFYGLKESDKTVNKFYKLDLDTLKIDILNDNVLVPKARYAHSMHTVNGEFFIVDGKGVSEFFTEVWAYSPITGLWREINTKGQVPSARSGHAADSQGDSIAIWGGLDQVSSKNDLFIFNTQTNTWLSLEPVNDIRPSAAEGACLVLNIPFIYIYGGVVSSGISSELWRFEMGENTYTHLSSDTAIAYCSCHIANNKFYVAFGSSYDESPIPVIREFDFSTKSWRTYHEHTNVDHDSAQAIQLFINGQLIRIGGEEWMLTPSNTVDISGPGEDFNIVGTVEEFIYNSGFAYFNTSIYIFGGGSVLGLNLRTSVPSALFMVIDMKDICNSSLCSVQCSKGTYLKEEICELCPPGTYSSEVGNGNCSLCPAGTYNPSYGGTSERQCYPCSEGTFSIYKGSPFCRTCPTNMFCPIGTIQPLDKAVTTGESSIQPSLYQAPQYSSLIYFYQISALSFYIILMMLLLSIQKFRNNIFKLDLYIDKHNRELNQKMILIKTQCGGIFSLLFLLVLLVFIGSTVISFEYGNIEESKNLVPVVVLQSEVAEFKSNLIEINLKFLTYGGTCIEKGKCTKYLKVILEYIYGKISVSCEDLEERACLITIICEYCVITPGAIIDIQMTEKVSYSSGIEIDFKSSSSIPSELSSVFISIRPPTNLVFIGSDPSMFYFSLTPSLFTSSSSQWPRSETGYHVSIYQPPVYGSMYQTLEIPSVSYLKAIILIDLSNEALLTARYFKQETVYFISNLFGSVFGIMGAVGAVMKSVESYYLKILNKMQNNTKTFEDVNQKRKNIQRLYKLNRAKMGMLDSPDPKYTVADDGNIEV